VREALAELVRRRESNSVSVKNHQHFNSFPSVSGQITSESLPKRHYVEILDKYSILEILGTNVYQFGFVSLCVSSCL
jgi:hypothetical protein